MKSIKVFLLFALGGISILFAQHSTETNIKMYSEVWDKVINEGKIDLINSDNFTTDVVMVLSPENIVGIDNFKDYYQNYLTGFSDIEFTIIDIFGQGDKLVKHWAFKGKNTGEFFGMPATGKSVDIEGDTLAQMRDGKIAKEQDFIDSSVFMAQLGYISDPQNLSVVQNLYDAFAKGDIPTVLAGLDDNLVWNEAEGNAYADGNPYVGPQAVLDGIFSRVGADYEYFKLKDIKLHEMSNNQVLATLRYDAKLKKNGAAFDAQVAHLWALNNGKVIAFQQYVDTKKLADAFNRD
ncbi:hypothetical protein SAMN03097699_0055 [Flavobacteriaceae bacterium MAR_2010_188]|nr:hypothetical protein SAMN03097699_0055 [Flavobacteriaceae bacterium MAR_2010_188]